MTEGFPPSDPAGESEERSLRRALRAHPLATEQLARIHERVEAEWLRVVEKGRRSRLLYWRTLVAASLMIGAALTWWAMLGAPANESLGVVAGGAAGDLRVERAIWPDHSLHAGDAIPTGLRMVAVKTTSVTLAGGGLMRLKAGTQISTTAAHELWLESGTVYIDIDPTRPQGTLGVRTAYGVVEHQGTQYEMALIAAALRVRVREGAVRVVGSDLGTVTAGQEVLLGSTGTVQRRSIATDSPEWNWVQEPPSEFIAEGQPVVALLQWTARETGRRLEFADEQTRQIAAQTILHGSIRGLSPSEALRAMLATTTLEAQMPPGEILIDSSPARLAPSAP